MDGRATWTDCDEAGNCVVPNVLSPRDLVSRPDIMDETVPHTRVNVRLTAFSANVNASAPNYESHSINYANYIIGPRRVILGLR